MEPEKVKVLISNWGTFGALHPLECDFRISVNACNAWLVNLLILHVQTHDVCEPETKDAVSEADHTEDKTVTEVTEEPVVEEPALQVSPEAELAATEDATETVVVEKEEETVMVEAEEPQEKTEDAVIIPAPVEEEKKNEAEVEVMAEQIEPEVPAEPLTTTQVPPKPNKRTKTKDKPRLIYVAFAVTVWHISPFCINLSTSDV